MEVDIVGQALRKQGARSNIRTEPPLTKGCAQDGDCEVDRTPMLDSILADANYMQEAVGDLLGDIMRLMLVLGIPTSSESGEVAEVKAQGKLTEIKQAQGSALARLCECRNAVRDISREVGA